MRNANTTGFSTTDDTDVPVMTIEASAAEKFVTAVNEGGVTGWLVINDVPMRLPSNSARTFDLRHVDGELVIELRRIAGGSNVTAVFVDAH